MNTVSQNRTFQTQFQVVEDEPRVNPERQHASQGTSEATREPESWMAAWSMFQLYGNSILSAYGADAGDTLHPFPLRTLPERLATILLELCAGLEDKWVYDVSVSTLAARLGTSHETTAAILRAFRRQGFVRLGYRRICMIDTESLQELGGVPIL